ncbi:aldo/keto reductase [Paenibacillus aceris]|uniref:Aldo/keto reductase-like oxidoreductase n=1 Tax=Paenibacillus aceris TaxID=869555 RepID=A0ABS4HZJ8_9BACL|nr:aldo/keto reductase [Paenibacillus aceris]MBP1963591.1 putative aldo/keto reductase-like oxidoreductase [Paenibacillus aceris]NHW36853.1 aldo/keto reductase [Paenibacillus aceris]
MEKRMFGRTGQQFPLLSFGAQRIVDEHNCTEEEAIAIVNRAIDEGITYFDTAPSYSKGQSEERLGKALTLHGRRKDVWIATKTNDRTRDGSLKLLEESLKRLQTDHVEEWRLHNIMTMEELDKCFAKGGALEALIEAKEQGMIKHISISGHTNPRVQLEAIDRYPFDSALVALSAADHLVYSFAHEFLPKANEKGIAVIGMKVMALGKLAPWYEKALQYTFSLPISTSIVGMESMEQLEKNLSIAKSFKPMTELEQLAFLKEIMHLANPDVLRWKSTDWVSGEWYVR